MKYGKLLSNMNHTILPIPAGWTGHFITIVTQDREHFLGEIKNRDMHFNTAGIIAGITWHEISDCRNFLVRGEYVIMPNHIHGILLIKENSTIEEMKRQADLSNIIRSYKGTVKKFCNQYNVNLKWQPGFHDQRIKSELEYQHKIHYIRENVKNWES